MPIWLSQRCFGGALRVSAVRLVRRHETRIIHKMGREMHIMPGRERKAMPRIPYPCSRPRSSSEMLGREGKKLG
eukprot:6183865-Pleurochrysis_carterae.AAC.4